MDRSFCRVFFAATLFFMKSSAAWSFGDVDLTFTHVDPRDLASFPSKNFGNEVLYQVFVDRFANGNPANDCLDEGRFCSADKSDWYRTWGGDLRGIVQKMPYLKQLGVTRVWLTPIFENQRVTVHRFRHGVDAEVTNYHGYWLKDLFRLNPTFTDGGSEDYPLMGQVIRAGLPQIRVLLDTAVNHTSPSDAEVGSLEYLNRVEPIPQQGAAYPRTHRGALFRAGRYVTSMDEDQWRISNEPAYFPAFHHNPPISDWDNPFQLENYSLDALADVSQDNGSMAQYMVDAHQFWLQKFPDLGGYRMDTIKHVPQTYWQRFSQEIYQSHPTTQIVGEYFGAGPLNRASYAFYRNTRMSYFDFDFRNVIESAFTQGGSFEQLANLWSRDVELRDARELVTFIDNHDLPRMRGRGMSLKAMKQAMALQFVSRGVPCMFYGQEQDLFFPNDPGDPYNRPMMTHFDETSEMFRFVRDLTRFRTSHDELRYGATHLVHLTPNIIGFERNDSGDSVFFATSKNPRIGSDEFDMVGLNFPDGTYEDALNGKAYRVSQGRIHVVLGNGDMILLSTRLMANKLSSRAGSQGKTHSR